MIEVQGLTKSYGSVAAVGDLSFSVAPGEVLGLVGPNGAGKTTTLRSLAGIVRPAAGTIRIGGHDMERDPVAAKRLLAFMPDEPHLFDYLTVEEHLRFTARLYQVADVERRLPALLQELELSEKAKALPGELSRGMKQKLVIGCGLLHDPRALLFDEPLTGLDPAGIRRMKQTIRERARQRSEEHTSELQSQSNLVCRLLLEKKKKANEVVVHFPTNYTIQIKTRIIHNCQRHSHKLNKTLSDNKYIVCTYD